MQINGQAALVTGGGSGLGEATARELARLGAKVAVLDLNLDNAKKVAADINGLAIQCDVSSGDSMQSAIEQAAAAHGPARILMQIAGIGSAKRVVGRMWRCAFVCLLPCWALVLASCVSCLAHRPLPLRCTSQWNRCFASSLPW